MGIALAGLPSPAVLLMSPPSPKARPYACPLLCVRGFSSTGRSGLPFLRDELRRTTSGKWEQPMDADFVFDDLPCREAP
jgi:hypothetical protein